MPEDDEAGVRVRGAEVLHGHGGTLLAVAPVERQRLAVRRKAAAIPLPVDIAEITFPPIGEPSNPIVDEVDLPIDITQRDIGDLRDLRQGGPVNKQFQDLPVLRLPAMVARWMPDRDGRSAPFAGISLMAGFRPTALPVELRPCLQRLPVRRASPIAARLSMEALQPPKACVFLTLDSFPQEPHSKYLSSPDPPTLPRGKLAFAEPSFQSPTIPGIGTNAEMGALWVPAKIHIHPEKREWKPSLSGCRRFLRDRLHLNLTPPFQSSVKLSF
ncbi:hypothetical protein [Salipiger aestuarii]|uniref:hypothetical protein n=1 Tax=Salipiger aestuarii TaxID=568098 RepID=UPI0012392F7B|nr:hypothetical protein [Salipiger aestuarii]